jgi:hypothetical protein
MLKNRRQARSQAKSNTMDFDALRTIRIHRWKWSRTKAQKFAQTYIDLISAKYPMGPEEETTYYVLPTFEHVTKFQPIVKFNPTEGAWELATTTLFEKP